MTNFLLLFLCMVVPVSQWGKASAAIWDITARGIPINGLAIWAASVTPIIACPVAVIKTIVSCTRRSGQLKLVYNNEYDKTWCKGTASLQRGS